MFLKCYHINRLITLNSEIDFHINTDLCWTLPRLWRYGNADATIGTNDQSSR
jgi:hypothetical protein